LILCLHAKGSRLETLFPFVPLVCESLAWRQSMVGLHLVSSTFHTSNTSPQKKHDLFEPARAEASSQSLTHCDSDQTVLAISRGDKQQRQSTVVLSPAFPDGTRRLPNLVSLFRLSLNDIALKRLECLFIRAVRKDILPGQGRSHS